MTKVLRGLHFRTDSGVDYYYDDFSGLVFPCPEGLKSFLLNLNFNSLNLLENSQNGQLGCWERFIKERHQAYGAFFGSVFPSKIPVKPNADDLAQTVKQKGFQQLILTVTGNCNMRCRYCVNSTIYPYSEKLSSNSMPLEVAEAALDYYFGNINKIRQRDPCKTATVTFYGGEPLLQFSLIKEVVHYIHEKKIENVLFNISTNGLLLDDHVADFLVANKFAIWVSLDGPKKQHDRNRILPGGKGSFGQVFANVERFWKRFPDYNPLGFLVTYDWGTDMRELWQFFKSRSEFKGSLFMFNPVDSYFTEYYNQFSIEERHRFFEGMNEIKHKLRTFVEKNDPVMNFLITAPYRLHLIRRILGTPGRPEIPATSCCLPGEKICVLPDGRLQPCERVPGLANVGTVKTGLNFEAVAELIYQYNQTITSQCRGCQILQLCRTCFSHFWSGQEFCKPTPSFCTDQIIWTKEILKETYSLLEKNPEFYQEVMKMYQPTALHQNIISAFLLTQ